MDFTAIAKISPGCSKLSLTRSRDFVFTLCFTCKSEEKRRANERIRTADLLITNWLGYVLVRPSASGNSAYLCGFGQSSDTTSSSLYLLVSVRLRYGCGKLTDRAAPEKLRRSRLCEGGARTVLVLDAMSRYVILLFKTLFPPTL